MSDQPNHTKGLYKVITWGTALSFGILAALAVSMKDFIGGNAAFDFSLFTVLAFVAGCTVGWIFWRIVLSKARRSPENKQSGST
jgi:hypothetical protein